MIKSKQLGTVALVSLLLVSILTPAAWAQSPAPAAKPTDGQEAAAGMANIVCVPAKTLFCIGSGVTWLGCSPFPEGLHTIWLRMR